MHLLSSHWILICMQIVKSFLRLILCYVDCSAIKSLQRCSLQQTYKVFLSFSASVCEGLIFHFCAVFQPKGGRIPSTYSCSFLSEGFCMREPILTAFLSPNEPKNGLVF